MANENVLDKTLLMCYYFYLNTHPGDPQCSDVLAVRGGPVAAAPQPRQDAAQALHCNATVNSMGGRSWGTRETRTGIVIPDGLHGRREYPCHHPQDGGDAHGRETPLPWRWETGQKQEMKSGQRDRK